MRKVNIRPFWNFGAGFRYLLDARVGWRVHGENRIEENLASLLKYIKTLGLRVTDRAAAPLQKFYETRLKGSAPGSTLDADQAKDLSKLMATLRPTLAAELEGVEAYILTPKRVPAEVLIENAGSLLAPSVFAALDATARFDLEEAAKCIAFERPTAAAFHLLRATEGSVKSLYFHFVKHNRESVPMWSNMLQGLRAHKKGSKHKALLDHLDNIRGNLRNPTQHPEMIYNIEEAQDLWAICVEALNRIHRVLHDGKAEPAKD